MRRLILLLGGLAFLLGVGGSANAGYWEVVYDLGQGSQLSTTSPAGTDIDLISGELTYRYYAPSPTDPLSAGRLMGGTVHVDISATNAGLFTLTGETDTTVSPPGSGTAITMTGAVIATKTGINAPTTGWWHCTDGAFPCTLVGFSQASTPLPATPATQQPWTFPQFNFTATAGVGDFTSNVHTIVTNPGMGTITLKYTYVGKEISRVYQADAVPTMSRGGLLGLGLFMLMSATLALAFRRDRRT